MIAFLEGELAHKAGARVVLDVGGVGYEVLVPASTVNVGAVVSTVIATPALTGAPCGKPGNPAVSV